MDIENGLERIKEFERSRFKLTEMPTQKVLEDFLKGAFGETVVTVVFDCEEGKFIRVPKEEEHE